ncbi:Coiled-coil domain-containing protein 51 [Habropoda laboriosa]|uniref:Coiled-coil domain-containing protein 51 n=1 Tax=Habropoda laboriosa TaxID=597456 RepID=A0A0L7QQC1_9HYME|nr:PREDICTED: coiled-coil domain-containing protein 51-like [Habropoda laboriosa]KOC60833.1 Coiled-coil domain-containing protein 51 [Habropoda laboriosa]
MAERFRSFMKTLGNEINKHRLFNNATTKINSVTGKAQEKLNNIQNAVALKYNVIAKRVNSDITLIQNLNASQLEPSPLPKKVVKWLRWYQQITGLDTVELAKQQVISAQNRLFKCQDDRRSLNCEAAIINDKLKEVYSELIQTKRNDPKYVQLTIIENKNLQDQARVTSQLNLLENEEKEHFTLLATAIKEYHDSQTMNAQKYKYLSILSSAILAIISLAGSMIYNNKRIVNIQSSITKAQQSTENIMQNNFHKLSEILKEWENNNKQEVVVVHEGADESNSVIAHRAYVLALCIVGLCIIRALTG